MGQTQQSQNAVVPRRKPLVITTVGVGVAILLAAAALRLSPLGPSPARSPRPDAAPALKAAK
jgi:hypothetical protein